MHRFMCAGKTQIGENVSTIISLLVNERPTKNRQICIMYLWPLLQDAEYRARNGVTDRETMEKAVPPLLSNFNLVVVAG